MNKRELIEILAEKASLNFNESEKAVNIIENNNIFNSKNKENIINELKEELNINELKAQEIYDIFMDLIKKGIKNKIKHPFKSSSNYELFIMMKNILNFIFYMI